MTLTPTTEQLAALHLFRKGDGLALQARAGTGKTTTLQLLAEDSSARGVYMAFNKAIVNDAQKAMPGNVLCSTAHSLAFRAIGRRYSHRLNSARMRSHDIARLLGVDHHVIKFGAQTKVLQPGYLAGLAMRAVTMFCQSADDEPELHHVPYIDGIDLPTSDGRRTYGNNREVALRVLPAMRRAWADLQDVGGRLPFTHAHYLKIWQLGKPHIPADFILFDEAQDANPVMLAAVTAQAHAQLVFVGDAEQAIYEFTGAVNALEQVPSEHTAFLTQSFRFGVEIAAMANRVLGMLGADPPVRGWHNAASVVGPVASPDVVLCRTNATAVKTVLSALAVGQRPHLVGGGNEVVTFTKAARDLMGTGSTFHPELACFDSWAEVQDYVENDQQGSDLRLLVKLIDEFGVDPILRALEHMPSEDQATLVVSTAHKSKGREWNAVKLADDFPTTDDDHTPSPSELRLLYVAVTRAKRELDVGACDILGDDEPDDAPPVLAPIDEPMDAKALTERFGTRGGGR